MAENNRTYAAAETASTEEIRYARAITADGRIVNIPVMPGQSIGEAFNEYFGRW